MSIPAILLVSLSIGLIAGAGIHGMMILPVAGCAAIVLFINRNKIAAQELAQKPRNTNQYIVPEGNYYAWPEMNRFAYLVTDESYSKEIQHLTHEGMDSLKAFLIPEDSNPYDSNAVRIVMNQRTVGFLNREESRSFRRRLVENGIAKQITTCRAKIINYPESDRDNTRYELHLDIIPPDVYDLPWEL